MIPMQTVSLPDVEHAESMGAAGRAGDSATRVVRNVE